MSNSNACNTKVMFTLSVMNKHTMCIPDVWQVTCLLMKQLRSWFLKNLICALFTSMFPWKLFFSGTLICFLTLYCRQLLISRTSRHWQQGGVMMAVWKSDPPPHQLIQECYKWSGTPLGTFFKSWSMQQSIFLQCSDREEPRVWLCSLCYF